MVNIYLKKPSIEELKIRQKWLLDKETMSYNAGYDIKFPGYNYTTGTIEKSEDELKKWYLKWNNKDSYFAYIIDADVKIPVGEIYFYYNNEYEIYNVGVLIDAKYRGKGYAFSALKELERVAFEEYNVKVLSDFIPLNRKSAIKIFEKAGFTRTSLIEKRNKFGKVEETVQFVKKNKNSNKRGAKNGK